MGSVVTCTTRQHTPSKQPSPNSNTPTGTTANTGTNITTITTITSNNNNNNIDAGITPLMDSPTLSESSLSGLVTTAVDDGGVFNNSDQTFVRDSRVPSQETSLLPLWRSNNTTITTNTAIIPFDRSNTDTADPTNANVLQQQQEKEKEQTGVVYKDKHSSQIDVSRTSEIAGNNTNTHTNNTSSTAALNNSASLGPWTQVNSETRTPTPGGSRGNVHHRNSGQRKSILLSPSDTDLMEALPAHNKEVAPSGILVRSNLSNNSNNDSNAVLPAPSRRSGPWRGSMNGSFTTAESSREMDETNLSLPHFPAGPLSERRASAHGFVSPHPNNEDEREGTELGNIVALINRFEPGERSLHPPDSEIGIKE